MLEYQYISLVLLVGNIWKASLSSIYVSLTQCAKNLLTEIIFASISVVVCAFLNLNRQKQICTRVQLIYWSAGSLMLNSSVSACLYMPNHRAFFLLLQRKSCLGRRVKTFLLDIFRSFWNLVTLSVILFKFDK